MGASFPLYDHLPRHDDGGDPSRGRDPSDSWAECLSVLCISICLAAVFSALFGSLFWYISESSTTPEYTVAITAVSGLDPSTDLRQGHGVLSPAFNLAVAMASHSKLGSGGCIGPGTSIRVSYSHVHLPMASGRAPEMCVAPGQAAGPLQAVARGHDVAVPGYLVDSLAEDMRRGEAMFRVQLTGLASPEEGYGRMWRVVTCWVRVGEADGDAMGVPCRKTYKSMDEMPGEDSGYVPHPLPRLT
ncbi:hypothetical protein HU200_039224 [Digitaria exilis]|uniref:Uncharacterized protein n=1 Tax=Digitaria exilis TaxID=1010633 RepID=A0A835EJP5_9POAL|nr:hypothetical protein HU200_039224 [Digitaria exilis]